MADPRSSLTPFLRDYWRDRCFIPSSVLTAAELRALPSNECRGGELVTLDAGSEFLFRWRAASMAADDGTTVLKPDDKSGSDPGRWIRLLAGTGSGPPDAHKTSHQDGGVDEISVAGLSGLLADPQTPLAHKTSHQDGGTDEISVQGLAGTLADPQNPITHAARHQSGGSDQISVAGLTGLLATAQTPTAHKTSHQDGGADEISVAGLAGLLADAQTPLAHKTSHQDGGSDEISVQGLIGLLADPQTPIAHKTRHQSGGDDAIKLDDLAAPDDNVDLNASTTKHGLLPKLSGDPNHVLLGNGTYGTPPAVGGGINPTSLAYMTALTD